MSISEAHRLQSLERQVAEQQRRIEALEAALRSRTPAALAGCNAGRQAEARRLDSAITGALTDHPKPERLTAKHILRALERVNYTPLPAERTVRLHLASIRGNGNTPVMPL